MDATEVPPFADEEEDPKENVRLLEHWAAAKACHHPLGAVTTRPSIICDMSSVALDRVLRDEGQQQMLDTYIINAGKDQMKYYKGRDAREQVHAACKSTPQSPRTTLQQKVQETPETELRRLKGNPSEGNRNAEVTLKIERELAAEVRNCRLRSDLAGKKRELKLLLSANGMLVGQVRQANNVFSHSIPDRNYRTRQNDGRSF